MDAIQWARAWYDPWRGTGQAVQEQLNEGLALWQALNRVGTAPVRFVPQAALPPGMAYERFISETRCCPVREGLHDFFNGLCWINFCATKTRLNQMQAAQIAQRGMKPVRGALGDALTLFDENAAFLRAPTQLWEALVAKQWQALFVDLRPLWRNASLVLFGHALLEKLQAPRKPVTAHVYRVQPATDSIADLDAWVARDLNPEQLACKPFAHLPVLGVPTWWEDNEDPGFYDDAAIFRRPRPALPPMQ